MTSNPFDNRDLITILSFPTLSWSSFSSFRDYDKDKWYTQYVLGKKGELNAVMRGGIEVGKRIVEDPNFLPSIPRGGVFEQELRAELGSLSLVGHMDHWWPGEGIDEYKTTSNPTRWTQKAVDEWGQLTFYCLLVYLNFGIEPEKLRLRLYSIPMQEQGHFEVGQFGEPTMFKTKRTTVQMLEFAAQLTVIHRQMKKFVVKKKNVR